MSANQMAALKEKVYQAFVDKAGSKEIVYQNAAIEEIPGKNPQLLLRVAQQLCDDKKWKIVSHYAHGIAWRVRTLEEAQK